jgi:hypothetical protein
MEAAVSRSAAGWLGGLTAVGVLGFGALGCLVCAPAAAQRNIPRNA